MKSYSPLEEPLGSDNETVGKPAPYNWLAILLIVIAYMVFAVVL